jgi:hypothetical protein
VSDVSYYEIPTQPTAQFFSISLNGTTYYVKLQWCAPAQCWIMELSDSNQDLIVGGIPLITGADLLEQLSYLEVGGSMFVQSDFDPSEVPDYASLGSTGHLYFAVPPLP